MSGIAPDCATLHPGYKTIKRGASGAALLRCSMGFRRPLLTGNGVPSGFSVLVRLAYKVASRPGVSQKEIMQEDTCTS
jgi:hypothetical protein